MINARPTYLVGMLPGDEALQYTGGKESAADIADWSGAKCTIDLESQVICLTGRYGVRRRAHPGDLIIRGSDGTYRVQHDHCWRRYIVA